MLSIKLLALTFYKSIGAIIDILKKQTKVIAQI